MAPDPPSARFTEGVTLARLAAPTAAEETTLAVVADPHVSTEAEGTWKVFHRTERRFSEAIADLNDRDLDAVLFAGDLTKDGAPGEFAAVDDALAALDHPSVSVPGNHDVPKDGTDHDPLSVSAFAERYGPGALPFRVSVGGVDVLGLNSAAAPDGSLRDTHDGRVSEAQLEWLAGELADAEAPLVLVHHNLPGALAQFDRYRERASDDVGTPPVLRDPGPLVDALVDGGASLLVAGHLHYPSVTDVRGVREATAPALCSFPQGYLLLTVDPAGTTVRLVSNADPDAVVEAQSHARDDTAMSRGRAALAAAHIAAAPLIDDRSG